MAQIPIEEITNIIDVVTMFTKSPPLTIVSVILCVALYALYKIEIRRRDQSVVLGNYRNWVYFQIARREGGTEHEARQVVTELDKVNHHAA